MEEKIRQLADNADRLTQNIEILKRFLDNYSNISWILSQLAELAQSHKTFFDEYGYSDYSELANNFRMAINKFAEIYQTQTNRNNDITTKISELINQGQTLINHMTGHKVVLESIGKADKNREINDKLLRIEQALQNKEISEEKASKLVQKLRNSTEDADIQQQLSIYKKLLNDNGVVTSEKCELDESSFDENGVQTIDEFLRQTTDFINTIEELVTSLTNSKINDDLAEILKKMHEISSLFSGNTNSSRVSINGDTINEQLTKLKIMIDDYYPLMNSTTYNLDEQVSNATDKGIAPLSYSQHEMFEAESNATAVSRNKLTAHIEQTEQMQENMPDKVCSVITTLLSKDLKDVKNLTSVVNSLYGTANQHVASVTQLETMETILSKIEKGITV